MSTLAIEIAPNPDATIVALTGAADLASSEDLDRELLKLSAQRPKRVIFDFTGLTFLSSLAMGLLIRFAHGLTNRGGKVQIAAAQPLVAEALRRIRMDVVLPMYATMDEASADK